MIPLDKCKKGYLYKIGMVNSYYSEMCKRDIFEVLNTFTFPILSDSKELINRYLKYEVLEYQDAFSTYFGQSIQAVLKQNDAELTRTIEGMNNHSKEGWEKNYRGAVTAFQGILKKEKELVRAGIEELLSCHGNQNTHPLTKEYINYEATALVKIANINGLDISIESQLIPNALLPVQELESYPRYDFFDELPDSL